MERYGMPGHIRAHSVMVEKIARLIAEGLCNAGANISHELVTAGALLHDIAKPLCLDSHDDHAEKGKDICLENHFEEIAPIVGEHILLKGFDRHGEVSEKEIVYYADKRVNHDCVVSLDERLAYLLDHYGKDNERICTLIRRNFAVCKELEEKLFERLDFAPDDVSARLTQAALTAACK
jgi:putative nucleotidyltransferase with HDIG domain